jgi:hypothetical protein
VKNWFAEISKPLRSSGQAIMIRAEHRFLEIGQPAAQRLSMFQSVVLIYFGVHYLAVSGAFG